jgi:hypothetical protein
MAEGEESNGNGSYRVTVGVLYEAQQRTTERLGELTKTVALMDARMNAILGENKDLRGRLEKIESRFNGILVGLGTGLVAGAIALTRVL